MARLRTVKPEYWTDEKVGECSVTARLLFIGCWNFSDDYGGLDRSAKQLKAQVFPYDNIDCEPLIRELMKVGLLVEYTSAGKKYLHIKGFRTHQRVEKPAKARIPLYEESGRGRGGVGESSPRSNGSSLDQESSLVESSRVEVKGGESPPLPVEGPTEKPTQGPGLAQTVDSFEHERAIQAEFPKGPNPPNWLMALRNASDLVRDGIRTWPELVADAERYARFIEAGGNGGVNIAAHNFFDRRKGNYWEQEWKPPLTKAEVKRDSNVDASLIWLAQQEAKDATG